MNLDNHVIRLCVEGTQAEFKGQMDAACSLYRQAWEAAQDDFELCVAAHYVARCHADLQERLRWNQAALAHADAAGDKRVQTFYPSLYLNMGQSYELLRQMDEAWHYYDLAAKLGYKHQGVDNRFKFDGSDPV